MAERCEEKPTVLVTGFGLFRDYSVNSSWEAVKLLQIENVHLVKREIPVVYSYVDEEIPKLWRQYKPLLVVHCGVSKLANCLQLESKASAVNYCAPDVNGQVPTCVETPRCDCLNTYLNIDDVCAKVTQLFHKGLVKLKAERSEDAGRYLCEYIYYKSLNEDPQRTVFIHVPELRENLTAADISQALRCTIEAILDQLMCRTEHKARATNM